jgi:hypothetical protein
MARSFAVRFHHGWPAFRKVAPPDLAEQIVAAIATHLHDGMQVIAHLVGEAAVANRQWRSRERARDDPRDNSPQGRRPEQSSAKRRAMIAR